MTSMTTDVSSVPSSQPPDLHDMSPLTKLILRELFCTLPVICVLLTGLLGYYHTYQHLRNKPKSAEKRLMMRILVATPIYSMYSFVVLYEDKEIWVPYLYIIKDCYGAYAMYGFVALCYGYIGGQETIVEQNTVKSLRFYERITLQYCFVRPALVFVSAYLQLDRDYKYGDWSLHNSYIYITIMTTFSVTLATYGLFAFLQTAKGMMRTTKPVLKFVTMAFIVFGTYWQGVLLSIYEEALTNYTSVDPGTVAVRYQSWLVCIEMLPAAILMKYAFPVVARPMRGMKADEHTVEYGIKENKDAPDLEPERDTSFKSSTNSLNPLL